MRTGGSVLGGRVLRPASVARRGKAPRGGSPSARSRSGSSPGEGRGRTAGEVEALLAALRRPGACEDRGPGASG